MDAGEHYRHLAGLGRDAFLAAAAPAAFVRFRSTDTAAGGGATTLTLDEDEADETVDETNRVEKVGSESGADLEVFPLAKKAGASFADRITIGRTSNNDIVIPEHSVSRLHAYVRQQAGGYVVADAGSKNGTWLQGAKLAPRKEQPLLPRAMLRVGEVDLAFYRAADLYEVLSGSRA